MATVSAQEWLDNWGNGLNGAGAKIKKGVGRVTQAPGQSAAAKQDKMRAGINAAIDSGKWASNVSAVTLPQWQDSMVNKGINNISAGVTQAKKNKVAAIQNMLAENDAAVASIANMPDDTPEQRMARALAFMRARADIANRGR